MHSCISFDSYIKPQPKGEIRVDTSSCISFDSYIKPQPNSWRCCICCVVYLLIPTSNHNPLHKNERSHAVVYLLIPTSNHNQVMLISLLASLYIFWFLHQTTTIFCEWLNPGELYIFWFLHQTTTSSLPLSFARWLYIFWFLHQTTTILP